MIYFTERIRSYRMHSPFDIYLHNTSLDALIIICMYVQCKNVTNYSCVKITFHHFRTNEVLQWNLSLGYTGTV